MANFKVLRDALGLPESTSEDDVMAAAGKTLREAKTAKDQLSQFGAQLAPHGLKLDQGKVFKTVDALGGRPDLEIREGDTEEVKNLKKTLKTSHEQSGLAQVTGLSVELDTMVKKGELPKSIKDDVAALLSIQGQSTRWMLATDGKTVVEGMVDAAKHVRNILDIFPKIVTADKLKQLATAKGTPAADDDPEGDKKLIEGEGKLSPEGKKLAQELAARADGRKLDAAPAGGGRK